MSDVRRMLSATVGPQARFTSPPVPWAPHLGDVHAQAGAVGGHVGEVIEHRVPRLVGDVQQHVALAAALQPGR